MNKFTKKQILLVLVVAITASTTLYGMIDRMKKKLYKSIEKPMVYNAGVYTIDKTAKLLSNITIKLAHITHTKETALQKIDRRLTHIKATLKGDEIKAINEIYKEFNVTNQDQQTINSVLSQYKEFQKQYLSQPRKQECDTLESTCPEILSFCKQVNIHLSAVELRVSNDDSSLVAAASGLGANYQFENDMLIVGKNDIFGYPTITLYPNFSNLSYHEGVATFGHELTHLALQHHEVDSILFMEIKYFTSTKNEDIKNSKNRKNLETIFERQAEILHKDAEFVSKMRTKRKRGYYPDHLFLNHYAQLTEIDELHKLKEKLTA